MPQNLILLTLFVFIAIIVTYLNNRSSMPFKTYNYLALGDSYTIGENIPLYDSFPYQTVQLLRKSGHNFNAPEIIAQTGWTTDDLKKGIRKHVFLTSYNVVSLLIGVNNQFQSLDVSEYALQFEQLLRQAIGFAGGENRQVFIFSIPDWGKTPFAAGRDKQLITTEISKYNLISKQLAEEYKVQYINIADGSELLSDEALLAADGLHPSAKEYARWAQVLADQVQSLFVYDKQEY